MEDLSLIAPFGKSNPACSKIEVKVKPDVEYIDRKQRNWTKLLEEFVSDKRDNIDWNYSPNIMDVNEIWEELSRKIKLKKKIFRKL